MKNVIHSLARSPGAWCAITILSVFAAPSARAQALSVVSDPVGFTHVTIPAATPGNTTRRALAIPYHRSSVFRGTMTSAGLKTLTFDGANWTAGQFTTAVHFSEVRAGGQAGRHFRITSNTTDTLTVDNDGLNLATLVKNGDTVEIFSAHTLGSLFGTTSVPFQTGADENTADLVRLRTAAGWVSYFHDGTKWRTPGSAASRNGVVLRPDEAVFIVARGNNPVSFDILGAVAVKKQRSAIPGSGQALLGNRFPAPTTLDALGIEKVTGWTAGGTAAITDNVLIWNGTAWNIFYFNTNNWERVGSFSNANNTAITATTAILINRKPDASGSDVQLSTTPPFTYP